MSYEMEIEEFPVLKYTVQLYFCPISLEANSPPPLQIASGVLIQNASRYFLLTCKHVFDDIKIDDVVILTSMGFAVRLPNDVRFINDDNDSIDLALIQFKGHRVKELKTRYSFLQYKNLGLNHVFDEELYYMLFGFVNKKTKLENYAFFAEPFGYLSTFRYYKKFEKLGFSYENEAFREEYDLFFEAIRQEQHQYNPIEWIDAELEFLQAASIGKAREQAATDDKSRRDWMTFAEMLERLGTSKMALRRRMAEGMPFIKFGAQLRFDPNAVDAWLLAQN